VNGTLAVPIVILVLALGFEVYCLIDIIRAKEDKVRYLPNWAWAVISMFSIPWGGLAYLIFGKVR